MKRALAIASVCCLALMGFAAVNAAQKGSNFAGTWVLDKSKSELPEMMQSITSLTWVVTQDDNQITRESKIEGGAGGPGGGRGMGGNRPITFKLDGSETTAENPRGKSTTKAKWMDGGKILEVGTVTNASTPQGDFTMTSTEHWELAEGGKVLKVHQTRETPRGAVETKMVFNKQ